MPDACVAVSVTVGGTTSLVLVFVPCGAIASLSASADSISSSSSCNSCPRPINTFTFLMVISLSCISSNRSPSSSSSCGDEVTACFILVLRDCFGVTSLGMTGILSLCNDDSLECVISPFVLLLWWCNVCDECVLTRRLIVGVPFVEGSDTESSGAWRGGKSTTTSSSSFARFSKKGCCNNSETVGRMKFPFSSR